MRAYSCRVACRCRSTACGRLPCVISAWSGLPLRGHRARGSVAVLTGVLVWCLLLTRVFFDVLSLWSHAPSWILVVAACSHRVGPGGGGELPLLSGVRAPGVWAVQRPERPRCWYLHWHCRGCGRARYWPKRTDAPGRDLFVTARRLCVRSWAAVLACCCPTVLPFALLFCRVVLYPWVWRVRPHPPDLFLTLVQCAGTYCSALCFFLLLLLSSAQPKLYVIMILILIFAEAYVGLHPEVHLWIRIEHRCGRAVA